jgi:hypothetical protein
VVYLYSALDSFHRHLGLGLGDSSSIDDLVDDVGFDQGFLLVKPANGPWLFASGQLLKP